MTKLQRTIFKASRAAEYVESHQLQAVTGQPKEKFAAVVVKELVDNALDACESAGQPPRVELEVERADGAIRLAGSDNGSGIPPETVRAALDFDVRVSDKAAYRSPTRGAQGNALKTVFGIPPALGSLEPVVVEARGLRHEVRLWKDPAGELRDQCDEAPGSRDVGTRVALSIPDVSPKRGFDPEYWARAEALFNPHAAVKIRGFEASDLGESAKTVFADSYHPTRDPAKRFKYLPGDPTSAHWYDVRGMQGLIYAHIKDARDGGRDLPLREFVRQFKGLSSKAKAKAVCLPFGDIKTLSDFEDAPEEAAAHLLREMRRHSDAPSHGVLGAVGREHFERRFAGWQRGSRGRRRGSGGRRGGTCKRGDGYGRRRDGLRKGGHGQAVGRRRRGEAAPLRTVRVYRAGVIREPRPFDERRAGVFSEPRPGPSSRRPARRRSPLLLLRR